MLTKFTKISLMKMFLCVCLSFGQQLPVFEYMAVEGQMAVFSFR